ncbi:MAG: transglycosylase domain-containing protein [Fimbriimonadaceae bacterium]
MGCLAVGFMFIGKLNEASRKLGELDTYAAALSTEPSVILSRNGKVLYTMSAEYREPAKIDEIPIRVQNAVLAAEDKRFRTHSGVDPIAIGRILVTNARDGRVSQGGSTVTMQLAKRLFSSSERTMDRKLDDIAMAMMIEREYTKDQILEMYLNQVYFGAGAYGIKAAAKVYFNKSLDELTVAEAAMIARLVQRPSEDNPFVNFDRAVAKRNDVLAVMLEEGMIDGAEYEAAIKEPVRLAPRPEGGRATIRGAPYFVNYVRAELRKILPDVDLSEGGYVVETTLDDDIQQVAEQEVAKLVEKYRARGVTTASFVLTDRAGGVLAMVGGVSYARNQFNAAYQGRRQPGSAFKPFVYAAALDTGAMSPHDTVGTDLFSYPMPYGAPPWTPKNSNGKYGGAVSLRTALAGSYNTSAARVMAAVGPDRAVNYARDVFGFTTPLPKVPSIVLGAGEVSPLEMAQAYSIFMLHGDRFTPYGITRVVGRDGQVLARVSPKIKPRALSPDVAATLDSYLRSVVTSGTGRAGSAVLDARGKTGTTSDHRDAWFCGYTSNLMGIGWIANEQYDEKNKRWVYRPMPRVFGGSVTIEMWREIMKYAQKKMGRGTPYEEPRAMSTEQVSNVVIDAVDDAAGRSGPDDAARASGDDDNDHAQPPVLEATPPLRETSIPPSMPVRTDPPPAGPSVGSRSDADMVTIYICADSRAVATMYCPEQVPRPFARGSAPTRRCTLHQGDP